VRTLTLSIPVMAGLLLSLAGTDAAAQNLYRCPGPLKADGSNSQVLQDRPCTGVPSRLGAYGGTPSRSTFGAGHSGTLAKAPEHLAYLSRACVELNEAIRTGPTRGLHASTLSELHANYQRQCSEDDREARMKAYETQQRAADLRRQQKQLEQAQRREAVNEASRCTELARLVADKRRRYDSLTPGQRDDAGRFEQRYQERCVARRT